MGVKAETWIAAILGGLLFGIAYNGLVGWLESRGYDRGYTAILVIAGVAASLALSIPLIGLPAALATLAIFAATGLPMTVGQMTRSAKARLQDERGARQVTWELLHDREEDRRVRLEAEHDEGEAGQPDSR